MTKLEGDSVIRRLVHVPAVAKPVAAEFTAVGIRFYVPGSRKKITVSWIDVVNAAHTPTNVPSFLMDRPLALLQHQGGRTE